MAWTPPKTDFSPGNVLTAAQMNAIGENLDVVGMHLIKTQTIGSAVSSVTVTSAFSADYDNYLINVTNLDVTTTGGFLFMRLGTSTTRTEYKYGVGFITYGSAGVSTLSSTSTAEGVPIGLTEDAETNFQVYVSAPFLAQPKTFMSNLASEEYSGFANGWDGLASSQDQFVLRVISGTMTGGTIRVYGYINS